MSNDPNDPFDRAFERRRAALQLTIGPGDPTWIERAIPTLKHWADLQAGRAHVRAAVEKWRDLGFTPAAIAAELRELADHVDRDAWPPDVGGLIEDLALDSLEDTNAPQNEHDAMRRRLVAGIGASGAAGLTALRKRDERRRKKRGESARPAPSRSK